MSYNEKFREIRMAKCITQSDLASGVISQSLLSKFERGEVNLRFDDIYSLLDKLGLSIEEFLFVYNNYKHSERNTIYHEFSNLNFNNLKELKVIRRKCLEYLENREDIRIKEISEIALFFIVNYDSKKMDVLPEVLSPIFKRINKSDTFFYEDIQLINNLLFMFPIENIKYIKNILLSKCEKYEHFRDANLLAIKIKVNITSLLLQNNLFEEALEYLIEIEKKHKLNMSVYMYCVVLSRIAICLYRSKSKRSKSNSYISFLKKAFLLLDVYEEYQFQEILFSEIELYIQDTQVLKKIKEVI